MKEKLMGALGGFGIAAWYVISTLYIIAPLVVLHFPFWVDLILIIVITSLPLIGEIVRLVLYVWAFLVVIKGPIDVLAIIFFVFFAIYAITVLIPMVVSLFGGNE